MDDTQVGTAATAGRFGMIVAAIATVVTLFSADIFSAFSRIDVVAVFGAGAAAGCAIAGLVAPRRLLDAIALAAGASLAGFLMLFWAESSSSTMAMLAWLLLVASCGGLVIGLSTGRPAVDARATAAMAGAAGRVRQAAVAPREQSPASRSSASATAAEAGWYPDDGGGQLRWWDGHAWTDHVRPLS